MQKRVSTKSLFASMALFYGRTRNRVLPIGLTSFLLFPCCAQYAFAQNSIDNKVYTNEVIRRDSVSPLASDAFGESWDPDTGSLRFSQEDVVLKGTGPDIRIGRNYSSGEFKFDRLLNYPLGDWVLSIPRIDTILPSAISSPPTPAGEAWKVMQAGASAYKRCTYFDVPASVNDVVVGWFPGYFMTDENGSRRIVMKRDPGNTIRPSVAGYSNYPAVARDGWQFDCLSTTSNGQPGEGFLGLAPNGSKYYFDYLAPGTRITTVYDLPARQARQWVTMYVSKIVDRFGNVVTFQYAGDRISAISASDGRKVRIQWRDDYNVISTISTLDPVSGVVLRQWLYDYIPAGSENLAYLSKVTLPDGSSWTYDLLRAFDNNSNISNTLCGVRVRQSATQATAFATITTPSGAVGKFGAGIVERGFSHVGDPDHPVGCSDPPPLQSAFEWGLMFWRDYGLISKTVSGPGLSEMTWTYRYSDAVASTVYDPCYAANTCVTTRTATEIDPDGNRKAYTFSTIQLSKIEGNVVMKQWLDASSNQKKKVTYEYAAYDQGPWPSRLGGNPIDANMPLGVHVSDGYQVPVKSVSTLQDGVVFSSVVNTFDGFARPTKVTKSSAPSP